VRMDAVRAQLEEREYDRCNTLRHTATHCSLQQLYNDTATKPQHAATRCNALQHTTTQCNALQCTAAHPATCCNTYCNTLHYILQHAATHTATRCNTYCNTLQHMSRYELVVMADSTENVTLPKSTRSRNSNFLVQTIYKQYGALSNIGRLAIQSGHNIGRLAIYYQYRACSNTGRAAI